VPGVKSHKASKALRTFLLKVAEKPAVHAVKVPPLEPVSLAVEDVVTVLKQAQRNGPI